MEQVGNYLDQLCMQLGEPQQFLEKKIFLPFEYEHSSDAMTCLYLVATSVTKFIQLLEYHVDASQTGSFQKLDLWSY